MTQVSMLAPGTDSRLPSSPHSRNAFGRLLDRGDVFTTTAVNIGFTAAEPLPTVIIATCGGPIRPPGRGVRIYCGSTGRAGRREDRTGGRTRERRRTSVAARSGRTSVRPVVVVHRGGGAVPHRRGHREVLRADLSDLPHDVGMDARRRTAADLTRPPRRETARLPRRRDRRPGAAGGLDRAGGGAGGRDGRRHRQPGAVHRAQGRHGRRCRRR